MSVSKPPAISLTSHDLGASGDAAPPPQGDTNPATSDPTSVTVTPSAAVNETTTKKISRVGDFQLLKKLGQGGMGTVYLARQVSLDRLVALKTLSKDLARRDDFVVRFLREARAMARLDHPNAVRVYAAESSNGLHFAAIEYVDGRSMQKWMDDLKQLPVGDALLVTLAAADALRHAHEQNMIHRDIKPDNILLTKRGVVKVADFGLAKAVDEDVSVTQSGTGIGTPLYMAPEQARNAKHVDQRTDVYALGCTLYYFLTGKPPFTGGDTYEIILAKEQGRFTSARRLNPAVPERLDLMIDKMISKDPQHRYANCAEVMKDLLSLGLAHTSLSFVDDALPSLPGATSASASGSRAVTKPTVANTKAFAAKSIPGEQRWFVLHTAASGQPTVSRMTTEQVLKGLKGGLFDPRTTRVKRSETDEFLPPAQFAELEAAANAIAARTVAERRGRGLKADFARLERQHRWRKRLRPLVSFLRGLGGLASLILWLAFLGGVLWATWYFGWDYVKDIAP